MCGCSRDAHRLGEGGVTTTPLLQYVARFDGGGETVGFEREGYQESRPWCSLFVGLPSIFIAPSGEQLALPMYVLEGDKLVHHIPRFRPHIFLRAKHCS